MIHKIYIKNTVKKAPERATEFSAGLDIVATSEPLIIGNAYEIGGSLESSLWNEVYYVEYETDLYLQPENKNNHISISPRSSISKYNLVLANSRGICDGDYMGMYKCRFKYVFQPVDLQIVNTITRNDIVGLVNFDKIYKKGDKIAQIMLHKNKHVEFEFVENLEQTDRSEGGFGSTNLP